MMDVKAFTFRNVFDQDHWVIHNGSHLPQLSAMDSNQDSVQQGGDSLGHWCKDPKLTRVNEFIRNNVAKSSMQKTDPDWTHWTVDFDYDVQHQLSVDGPSKEPMSYCSAIDDRFFEGGSLNYSKGFSLDVSNQGVATTFMNFRGTGMLSPMDIGSEMVPSEQISSITECSDQYVFSDTGPSDGGPTFPGNSLQHVSGSSSNNFVQQMYLNEGELNFIKHGGFPENNENGCMVGSASSLEEKLELLYPNLQNLQQDPQMTPEFSGILHREIFYSPLSTNEDLLESKLRMLGSKQFHQGHQQPYMQFDNPSEAQSPYYPLEEDNCFSTTTRQKASKLSSLPSEQSHGPQQINTESSSVLFGPTGAAKFVDSSQLTTDQRILFSYMNYSRMHVDGSQVSFVKHIHSKACSDFTCNCERYFALVSHFDNCHCWGCHMCRPVRRFCVTGKPPQVSTKQEAGHLRAFCNRDSSCISPDPAEEILPPSKRLKTRNPSSLGIGVSDVAASSKAQPCEPQELAYSQQWPEASASNYLDDMGVSTPIQESTSTSSHINDGTENAPMSELKSTPIRQLELIGGCKEEKTVHKSISEVRNSVTDILQILNSCSVPVLSEDSTADQKEEERQFRTKSDQVKQETKSGLKAEAAGSEMKLEEPKITGVSLIDFFTVEEVKEHLFSLRQWISQEVQGSNLARTVGENSCQLCAMNRLMFAPTPTYCSSCSGLIKHGLMYYSSLDEMGVRYCFCTPCFKGSHGSNISFQGISMPKAKFQKERNNIEDEESWVQCDKCKCWQHQICALYNDKRDLGGKVEYLCPKCCLEGIEVGRHVPLPKTASFGAKCLPTSMLSEYMEQRLFTRLQQDREERAKALHKKPDEVPGAADLVVRVVLSVNKLLKVNQQFLDVVRNENYPTEFPYRSKVILLFQKIEGVDVCLFGMYVQEFGSECGYPNHRCVYISYLDSVKYFRPEIKTASGEALRTFVYHEILVGYLDYCKKRGFATCYIWACPPLKGEDYILYCHPERQKTPKSDKLRQWYKSMLRKATKENIVVGCSNLYEHLFVPIGECTLKITAARLPYFDGDYWSRAAIDYSKKLEQESRVGSQNKAKKNPSKRTLKAMGYTNLSGDATNDILLMQRLGQTMLSVKEDFTMVHLQFTCTRCCEVILSGSRWFCSKCKNFQLCERCHDAKQYPNEGYTHFSSTGEKHSLSQVAVIDVPVSTDDPDGILDNSYFENRNSFLSICQENHYQFDTLRRAKHSSMMILHYLINSTEPIVGTSCCICHQDIVVDQGWHCEICPGFDACDRCYQRKGSDCHTHKLSQRSTTVSCGSKNEQDQQQKDSSIEPVIEPGRRVTVKELLDVLMHTARCSVTKRNTCSYPHCLDMRKLFRHASQCNLRVAGGCQICWRTWFLMKLHSKDCTDSNCRVPRCRDLKKHAETQQRA